MNRIALREMVHAHGVGPTARKLYDLLQEKKIVPEQFSVRELWETFNGPLSESLPQLSHRRGYIDPELLRMAGVPDRSLREAAIDTTAFATIIGSLISAKVIEAYNMNATIGRSLVTVMPSKHKTETLAGFKAYGGLETVLESEEYPEKGYGEKYVTTTATKKGLRLSVTEETIMEDQTGQILTRAGMIGERARLEEEETILKAVMNEVDSYWPAGTATTLYATDNSGIDGQTNANLVASNGLDDWTDIQAAELALAAMVDEEGKRIVAIAKQILVPTDLLHTAKRIINATTIDYGTDEGGGAAAQTTRVQVSNTVPAYQIVTSPLVSALQASGGTTNWFLGDFKRQFILQEVWPIQVFRRSGQQTEDGFKRDVVEQYKVRLYIGVAALDHRYVIKNTA